MQGQRMSGDPSGSGLLEAMNRLVESVLMLIMTDAPAQ